KSRRVFGCVRDDHIREVRKFLDDSPIAHVDPKISRGDREVVAGQLMKKYQQTASRKRCFPRPQDGRQPGGAAVAVICTAGVMQKNIRLPGTCEGLRKLFRVLIELCNCRMAELGS